MSPQPDEVVHLKVFTWLNTPSRIAAKCGQRMEWSGRNDILALSGGNILVFVSICQHIWGAWARSVRGLTLDDSNEFALPRIDPSVQAVGIQSASVHWFNKMSAVSQNQPPRVE
jgi:hypothetical protein